MQITKARLKQIIQEEFSRMNEISSEPIHIDVNSSEEASMGEISEDGHTDVSSAIRSMKLIIEDASEILEGLMQISKNGELPSWWMNKVAVAKKDLNSCRDYFLVSEEAKPDFLDLDKDGDKEEPMKKAAKEAEQQNESLSDDLLEALIRKQLQKKTKISEALSLHIKEGVGIERNIFRPGSDSYFALISEARRQYKNGDYSPINEEELELLESNVGEFGVYEGEKVPLDFPMIAEAEYKGKKVELGKPTRGDSKKYKVYVRNPKTGNVVQVNYGDKKGGLESNWNNAEARASFAARHNCAEKKDRTKAGYWACRAHKDFGKNVPGRFW